LANFRYDESPRSLAGMKVIVCGSIGYGGLDEIRALQKLIKEKGFEIIDHISGHYSSLIDPFIHGSSWGHSSSIWFNCGIE